jgi:hypothetical protein
MKLSYTWYGSILAAALLAAPAVAQQVGEVTSTSGALGNVLVTRDGETYPILAGDPVFADDVISTRRGGTVQISANGCSVGMGGLSEVAVNSSFCAPGAVAQATSPTATVAQATPTVAGISASGTTVLLGLGGVAVLGALAAGGGDDSPASP